MKYEILLMLKEAEDFLSGEDISEKFGVTRAAIWKNMKALKEEGYEIESVSRKGYRLVSSPKILTATDIKVYLATKYVGEEIINHMEIDSTNEYAKKLALQKAEGTVITAEKQVSGKGRIGRSWESPLHKGIYMSIILKPRINPINAAKITLIGAAAVHRALKDIGIDSKIKWPNDIVIDGKKVCGILTEMNTELDRINYIILGIGINANQEEDEIAEELKEKATSLKIISQKQIDRNQLLAYILNHFESLYEPFKAKEDISRTIDICRENSAVIGREVRIIEYGTERIGKAIDLNEEGELVVDFNGKLERIFSGEISIRGMNNSYI